MIIIIIIILTIAMPISRTKYNQFFFAKNYAANYFLKCHPYNVVYFYVKEDVKNTN